MMEGFEIKCKKCGNVAVDVKGTSVRFGNEVRVQFKCLVSGCGYVEESPVTQISVEEFYNRESNLTDNGKV